MIKEYQRGIFSEYDTAKGNSIFPDKTNLLQWHDSNDDDLGNLQLFLYEHISEFG